MLGTETADWISIYKSTPGRRAFAASQVENAATNYPEIVTLAHNTRVHDEGVARLNQEWLFSREDEAGAEANSEAVAADQRCDRWTGSTFRTLTELATLEGPRGQAATRLLRKHFPAGAESITSSPFAEANATLKVILEDLAGPSADDVNLAGVADHVAELAKARTALDTAMRKQKAPRAISFDEVRSADRQGQGHFSDLVIAILYHTRTPEQRLDRAALLRPIEIQNDALRELHRSRRRITDVNPETGASIIEPTQPDAPPAEPNPPE